jgi:hypothetical protein
MNITEELLDELRDIQFVDNNVEDARRARKQVESIVAKFSVRLEAAGRLAEAVRAYYEDDGVEICMTCRHEKYYSDSSGVSFSGGWQCEPEWWVRKCQHPDPEARAQVDEIYDEVFPDGGTKYGVHIPPVVGCQWWEADDDMKAERLLESLTPGGSEFSGSPEACARWVKERLAGAGKLAAERNRYREQAARLVTDIGSMLAEAERYGPDWSVPHFLEDEPAVARLRADLAQMQEANG